MKKTIRHSSALLFFTIKPAINGLIIPGIVAKVFDIPIKTLACCGAISKWFTAKPDHANAPQPTATVIDTTLPTGFETYAATIMKTVCAKNAPQLKYLRTCVVVK